MKKLIFILLLTFPFLVNGQSISNQYQYYYGFDKYPEVTTSKVVVSENINEITIAIYTAPGNIDFINLNLSVKTEDTNTKTYKCTVKETGVHVLFSINSQAAWLDYDNNMLRIFSNNKIVKK